MKNAVTDGLEDDDIKARRKVLNKVFYA